MKAFHDLKSVGMSNFFQKTLNGFNKSTDESIQNANHINGAKALVFA
tara:strand:+ start:1082 stop:1222 length:141 start_codon:yes stop_codon:yes gene_type:complete